MWVYSFHPQTMIVMPTAFFNPLQVKWKGFIVPETIYRQVSCHSNIVNPTHPHQFIFKCLRISFESICIMNDENLLPVETNVFFLYVIKLAVNNNSTYNKQDGNGEFKQTTNAFLNQLPLKPFAIFPFSTSIGLNAERSSAG